MTTTTTLPQKYTTNIPISGHYSLDTVEQILTTIRGLAEIAEINKRGRSATPNDVIVIFELDDECQDLWDLRLRVEQLAEELHQVTGESDWMKFIGKPEALLDRTQIEVGDIVDDPSADIEPFEVVRIEEKGAFANDQLYGEDDRFLRREDARLVTKGDMRS